MSTSSARPITPKKGTLSFGPFTVIPARRLLLDGDRTVRLSSRAWEILIALISRPGELLTKRELIEIVWPDTTVVEANLTVHVATLRRALGDGQGENRYIINIPGRGYRFVAPITVSGADPIGKAPLREPTHSGNLPYQVTRLIGREDALSTLIDYSHNQRLLTLVGEAGVGKTTLALTVAGELIANFVDGVWFVDLSPLTEAHQILSTLGNVLGLEIGSDGPLPAVISALVDKTLLLVLDNCEHLIDHVAGVVHAIMKQTPAISILATSREPLRVEGERLFRLPALSFPGLRDSFDASQVLNYPAVQLFVQRAAASMNDFEVKDDDVRLIAEICSRLDGNPLCIELAAARVATLGVEEIAKRLDDRLGLLKGTRRAAPARQQTITAALDWSYQLLTATEQLALRRMAVFAGSFTLDAAGYVASDGSSSINDASECIAGLVAKSLIVTEANQRDIRFNLLETTRAYASEKLRGADEGQRTARRHAEYYRHLLETALNTQEGDGLRSNQNYAAEIGNIRAALAWSFSSIGDDTIGVAIAAASAWIWIELSLLTECLTWMRLALQRIGPADRETKREAELQYALGFSSMFSQGISSESRAALLRAKDLSEALEFHDCELRALATLVVDRHRAEDFEEALTLARRSELVARAMGNKAALVAADFSLGAALFFLGDYTTALPHLRSAHDEFSREIRETGRVTDASWDRCVLPQALWLLGDIDQANRCAQEVLHNAELVGRAVLLCRALTWSGCDMSLRLGKLDLAERSILRLKEISDKHSLSTYYPCAIAFEGQLAVERGDTAGGEKLLRKGILGLQKTQSETQLYAPFLGMLAEVLALNDNVQEGIARIDEALDRTNNHKALWWIPEALRTKGELLRKGDPASKEAADLLGRSLALARGQGALSWELRTATSLGGLYRSQNRTTEAYQLLDSIRKKFRESFLSPDLRRASELLDLWKQSK